jgi:hypothetical protein
VPTGQPSLSPPPCPEAFAPLRDAEFDQCPSIRTEHRAVRNSLLYTAAAEEFANDWAGRLGFWVDNREQALRMAAPLAAGICLPAHGERIARRSPEPLDPAPTSTCGITGWLFAPLGCRTITSLQPDYEPYYRRVLDLDARLKLLQSVFWLRSQQPNEDTPEALFARRPPTLTSPAHEMAIDPAAGLLRVRTLDASRGQYWEIPYRAAATPTPDEDA